ncbi:MAG: hypothetical protein K0S32_2861 [Bacteroidetes bacterium]|jgi:hypothetical protein|nr:hypothetical protein [Bacteroidota bacterium]
MRRIHIILLFFFSFAFALRAQKDSVYTGNKTPGKRGDDNKEKWWKDKLTYGGNVDGFFTQGLTYIYISPTIGYMLTEKLNVGVGFVYNYSSTVYGYQRYNQSVYGGHSYANYFINNNLFVRGQYDKLYQNDYYNLTDPKAKTWIDYVLVGGGYSQPVGESAVFTAALMYNLTPHRLSIYPGLLIYQIGFVARFH